MSAGVFDQIGWPAQRRDHARETLGRRAAVERRLEPAARGAGLGVDFGLTVSCYQADEQGRACGRCDACRLRAKGFEEAGWADPTRYQRPALKTINSDSP